MSIRSLAFAAVALSVLTGAPALAQTVSPQLDATIEAASEAFSPDADAINTYALENRVDDTVFETAPAVDGTVGEEVTLTPVEGYDGYSYVYYEGRPVIVDNETRTIVSVGEAAQ